MLFCADEWLVGDGLVEVATAQPTRVAMFGGGRYLEFEHIAQATPNGSISLSLSSDLRGFSYESLGLGAKK